MLDEFSYMEFFVRSFLGDRTRELQLWDGDRMIGLGSCDLVMDVWSSVYFFFDPEYSSFSPGHYSMLLEIHLALEMGYDYYYPGFLIHGISAMEYKNRLRPGQIKIIGKATEQVRRVSASGTPAIVGSVSAEPLRVTPAIVATAAPNSALKDNAVTFLDSVDLRRLSTELVYPT